MSAEQWCGVGLLASAVLIVAVVLLSDARRARQRRRAERTVVTSAEQLTRAQWERAERERAVWESMIQRLNDGSGQ